MEEQSGSVRQQGFGAAAAAGAAGIVPDSAAVAGRRFEEAAEWGVSRHPSSTGPVGWSGREHGAAVVAAVLRSKAV